MSTLPSIPINKDVAEEARKILTETHKLEDVSIPNSQIETNQIGGVSGAASQSGPTPDAPSTSMHRKNSGKSR